MQKDWVTNIARIARLTKFNKILDLQAEKTKNGLEKSANFATDYRKSNKNFSRYL